MRRAWCGAGGSAMGGRRRRDAETTREEAVNVLLAELFRDRGLSARAERRSRSGVPDMRVALHGKDSVILDCKWDGSATALQAQLDERLSGFPNALGVIGVLYPERMVDMRRFGYADELAAARAGDGE